MERLRFTNPGTEATMHAIRLAQPKTKPQRPMVRKQAIKLQVERGRVGEVRHADRTTANTVLCRASEPAWDTARPPQSSPPSRRSK